MKRLLSQIIGAIVGFWVANLLIPGMTIKVLPQSNFFNLKITAAWQIILISGIVLGLINFFLKPIIDIVTFPLKIITLGLFSLLLNMGIIWLVDIIFAELTINGFFPLLFTTLIILFFIALTKFCLGVGIF